MLNILSVISKEDLNNDYYQIEHCGIYDSCVSGYYVVIAKRNFDRFCDKLGAETDAEKRDILNKINLNQIKPIILEELDTVHESITGHLCDIYDDEDGMLEHYGLIESNEFIDDFGDFEDPTFGNIDFIEEPEPEPEIVEPVKPVERVVEEVKVTYSKPVVEETPVIVEEPVRIIEVKKEEPPKPEVKQVLEVEKQPIIEEPKTENDSSNLHEDNDHEYNKVMEEPKTEAVYSKALEILASKIGLDYEELIRQAECEIATEENPDFTLEEVEDALELLYEFNAITKFESEFITNMYKQGNEHDVTQLLAGKLELLGGTQ